MQFVASCNMQYDYFYDYLNGHTTRDIYFGIAIFYVHRVISWSIYVNAWKLWTKIQFGRKTNTENRTVDLQTVSDRYLIS